MPRLPQPASPKLPQPDEAVGELLGTESDLGAPVTAVLSLGDRFAAATGDGRVAFADRDFATGEVLKVHDGAILSMAATRSGVVTGGDDSRVMLAKPSNGICELWRGKPGQWVDQVACGQSRALAWTCGKTVHLRLADAQSFELVHPSSIGGLAFAPQSTRLAAAHYGGVTIWDFAVRPPAKRCLEWKGSHLELSWSLDERFIVTAMQEGALHGWRLADAADFQMSGYAAKPRSLSWSRRGDWLTTSGTAEVLLWSFKGKKGPMGKAPEVLSSRAVPISRVAFHPLNTYVAAGYEDGAILLARQEDRRGLMVHRASGIAIWGLAWLADGRRMAYGTDDGRAGVVDFSALDVRKGESG